MGGALGSCAETNLPMGMECIPCLSTKWAMSMPESRWYYIFTCMYDMLEVSISIQRLCVNCSWKPQTPRNNLWHHTCFFSTNNRPSASEFVIGDDHLKNGWQKNTYQIVHPLAKWNKCYGKSPLCIQVNHIKSTIHGPFSITICYIPKGTDWSQLTPKIEHGWSCTVPARGSQTSAPSANNWTWPSPTRNGFWFQPQQLPEVP